MKPGALPYHGARSKLTIVRPGDAAQAAQLQRELAAQEDLLRASAAPRRSPAPCTCVWDGVAPEAAVDAPAGRALANTGRFAHGRKVLALEELLYLAEARALAVLAPPAAPGAAPVPLEPAAVFAAVLQAGLPPAVYTVYAHLKRLGYALRRHFDHPPRDSPERNSPERASPERDSPASPPPVSPDAVSPAPLRDDVTETPKGGAQPPAPGTSPAGSSSSNSEGLSRTWWPPCEVPWPFSTFRWAVKAAPRLGTVQVPDAPRAGETFTRVVARYAELLACYDVVRPGRRPGGPPDMYVVVATSLPALDVLRALERCARGRPVRIACCTETGGLAFYSSEAYVFFV